MQPHGLGRLFWHTVKLTDAPRVHRGKSAQYDWPYRYARPWIFRLPAGYGLAVGWWRDREVLDITAHLADALVLGIVPDDEDDLITTDADVAGEEGTRLVVTIL
jgi:hypothetical protein